MAMVNETGVSANVTRIKPNTRLTSQLIHVITLKKNPHFCLLQPLKEIKEMVELTMLHNLTVLCVNRKAILV